MIAVFTKRTREIGVLIMQVDEHWEMDINGVFVFSGDTLQECFEELENIEEKFKNENALFKNCQGTNGTQKPAKEIKN